MLLKISSLRSPNKTWGSCQPFFRRPYFVSSINFLLVLKSMNSQFFAIVIS